MFFGVDIKKQPVVSIPVLAVFILLVGCSNPEKQALDSFQPVIKFLSSETNSDGNLQFKDFSFDISKTDSIVSPFTGNITFKSKSGYSVFICNFAMQNNKWVHKKIETHLDDLAIHDMINQIDNNTNFINDEVRETDKSQNVELIRGTADMEKSIIDRDLSNFLHCAATENNN